VVGASIRAVGGEHLLGAQFFRLGIEYLLRQFSCVAQSHVEALSGDRVQRLRGVAEQHDMRHRRLPVEELKVDGLLYIL
jgi:hypothetical protein